MQHFNRLIRVFLLAASLSTFDSAISFAVEPSTLRDWEALVDRAAHEFTPPATDDLLRRRQELLVVTSRLKRALAAFDTAGRETWESYLHTAAIENSLDRDQEAQLAVMEMVRESLTADIEGLESDEIVALRSAVKNYAAALKRTSPELETQYKLELTRLRDSIRRLSTDSPTEAAREISLSLARIEEAGQAPELVAAIRRHWAHPNAVIRIETGFVGKYVGRDINESSMQRANVLGTQTRGPSQTLGKLELVSVENPNQAEVMLRMAGSTRSASNVGTNGPAVICGWMYLRQIGRAS